MYRIKYNYDTGDSFANYPDNEEFLELEWQNIEVARANLVRIKEHYEQYRKVNSWGGRGNDQEYCINLYTDDNVKMQIMAPWCGYFESLNSAEIVGKTFDKIEF